MANEEYPSYRWVILLLSWLAIFSMPVGWYFMPGLQGAVIQLYGIASGTLYLTIFTSPFLLAAIVALPGGMLADNLGIKRAASLGILVSAIAYLIRGFWISGPMSLLFAMSLAGVGFGLLFPNLPKLVGVWFPPNQSGLATGVYNTGMMAGFSTGMLLGPPLNSMLGGGTLAQSWPLMNYGLGALMVLLTIIFYVAVQDTPPGKELPPTPLIEGVQKALHSRSAWGAAIAVFLSMGGMFSFQSQMPTALNTVYGISMATGATIASVVTWAGIVGALILPSIADRVGRRKPFQIIYPVMTGLTLFLTWYFAQYTVVLWIGVAIGGLFGGGTLPMFMSVPPMLPQVKGDPVEPQHIGGASGLLIAFMTLGGFLVLPYLIFPLISSIGWLGGYTMAFVVFAAGALMAFVIVEPSPE